jgi:hypothetical protein
MDKTNIILLTFRKTFLTKKEMLKNAGLMEVANYRVDILSTWLYGIFGFIIMAIALV